jgi:hypothetical protein
MSSISYFKFQAANIILKKIDLKEKIIKKGGQRLPWWSAFIPTYKIL